MRLPGARTPCGEPFASWSVSLTQEDAMTPDPHDQDPAEDPEKMDDADDAQEEAARQREEEGGYQ